MRIASFIPIVEVMFSRKNLIIGITVVLIAGIAAAIFLLRPAGGSFESMKETIYPQFVRADHKNLAPIVTRPFSDDLDIAYVMDKDKTYDFIMKSQMRDWAVSDLMIHDAAMVNLE